MKLFILLFSNLALVSTTHGWDFTYKLNAYQYKTSNVNLDSTNTSDTATNYNLMLQTKEGDWKIKFKAQVERYQKETQNDFYTTEIGGTYYRTRDNDYTLSYFKQVYNNTPAINADYAGDNSGIRFGTNFYNEIDDSLTSYVSLGLTAKNYNKLNSRQDRSLNASVGLEATLSSIFTLSPDLSVSGNSSNNSDYNLISFGPSVYLSVTPTEELELFGSSSYNRSIYKDRTVQTTNNRGRPVDELMYQELIATEFGATYSITKHIPITFKYSMNNNKSNNDSYDYKANTTSFGLGYKF